MSSLACVLLFFIIAYYGAALLLGQDRLASEPAGYCKLLLKHWKALLVEVRLLADSEGSHELVDTLGLLGFASTDPLEVDVSLHLDLVAP